MSEAPAAAIAAFLRGVERRGAVFAELQCGDAEAGDAALAGALRAFRRLAADLPLADWPRHFWSLLAASPPLRRDAAQAQWPAPLQTLAGVAPPPRAALLLRLAAGLDEADAAVVLGLDEAGHRQALAEACPRDAAGQPDAAAWRALGETIQRRLRELPPARLAQLARLREDALADSRPQTPAASAVALSRVARATADGRKRQRWLWWGLSLVIACAVAFAAWYWWPQIRALSTAARLPAPIAESASVGVFALADAPAVVVEDLPPAEEPAARVDAADATATIALPADETEEAILRQADFYAWFVAAAEVAEPEAAKSEVAKPETTEPAPATELPLPVPDTSDGLVERWPTPADPRALYAQRAAWEALDEGERAQLRAAALRFTALAMPQRQDLHARYDALDELEKRGWRLGPALGAPYPRLHALLAYVPMDEAGALHAALKSMDAAQRDGLAVLAQRTPPQEADALRREWLATPPAQRAAWLQRRLQR